MTRRAWWCILVAILLALVAILSAGAAPAERAPRRDWSAELERLTPSDPMAYFELAEEVADVAEGADEIELARRLFALSGLLDRQHLARSACLALADLVEDEQEHRQLRALASLLGDGRIGPAFTDGVEEAVYGPRSVIAVTEAFSHYRRGQGSRALGALREPGAMELLEACDRFLYGGVHRFLEDCKLYRGRLRPGLSAADRDRMLRLELALLTADARPWSSELLVARGQPLVEVDPQRLEDTFGVDASRPVFRDGRWMPDPDAPEEEPDRGSYR